jgi:hypothetical protein
MLLVGASEEDGMQKRKGPELVRPANPEMAREVIARGRGSRAGAHGRSRGRNRANTRAKVMAFERSAA